MKDIICFACVLYSIEIWKQTNEHLIHFFNKSMKIN